MNHFVDDHQFVSLPALHQQVVSYDGVGPAWILFSPTKTDIGPLILHHYPDNQSAPWSWVDHKEPPLAWKGLYFVLTRLDSLHIMLLPILPSLHLKNALFTF